MAFAHLVVGYEGEVEHEKIHPHFQEHVEVLEELLRVHVPGPTIVNEIVAALEFFCAFPIRVPYENIGGPEEVGGKLLSIRVPDATFRRDNLEWVYNFVQAMPRRI